LSAIQDAAQRARSGVGPQAAQPPCASRSAAEYVPEPESHGIAAAHPPPPLPLISRRRDSAVPIIWGSLRRPANDDRESIGQILLRSLAAPRQGAHGRGTRVVANYFWRWSGVHRRKVLLGWMYLPISSLARSERTHGTDPRRAGRDLFSLPSSSSTSSAYGVALAGNAADPPIYGGKSRCAPEPENLVALESIVTCRQGLSVGGGAGGGRRHVRRHRARARARARARDPRGQRRRGVSSLRTCLQRHLRTLIAAGSWRPARYSGRQAEQIPPPSTIVTSISATLSQSASLVPSRSPKRRAASPIRLA